MLIYSEGSSASNTAAMEKGVMVPMARQWPQQSSSVILQTKHSLSVTFLRDFHGVGLKLHEAPEITRNFVTFHQFISSLGVPQSTNLPRLKNSVKMLDWSDPSQTAANRAEIVRTLRQVIKGAVVEFRSLASPLNVRESANSDGVVEAVPVSFMPPSTSRDMVSSQKKRVTTLLIGEALVSFELPDDCLFHPDDVDELVEVEKTEAMAQSKGEFIYNVPRFSFEQRLEGWKMERRQRINGRFDMYYHHQRSRRVFRSIAEVVNFFIYEVYPDKPSTTQSNLTQFPNIQRGRKQKTVTPLKSKVKDESKKRRQRRAPTFFDMNNVDSRKAYGHHRHVPMFDLNDDHQVEEEETHQEDDLMYDVVGDNYDQDHNEAYDHKATVENFLAESYHNLMNLPNDNDGGEKPKSFSFDINEKICEEEAEDDANEQTAEELLGEAYDSLINYHKIQPNSRKGKEKVSSCSKEKPRRKKVKTFTPTCYPSFPNTPINMHSIPLEKNNKEKITKTMEFMEVPETPSITNVKRNHFNAKEVNKGNNFFFADICESTVVAVTKTKTPECGGRSSSIKEVNRRDNFLFTDICKSTVAAVTKQEGNRGNDFFFNDICGSGAVAAAKTKTTGWGGGSSFEVNRGNNFIYTDICESSAVVATTTMTTGWGGRSSSTREVNRGNNFIFTDICQSSVVATMTKQTTGVGGGNSSTMGASGGNNFIFPNICDSSVVAATTKKTTGVGGGFSSTMGMSGGNNFMFPNICESSVVAAMTQKTTEVGGGSSSTMGMSGGNNFIFPDICESSATATMKMKTVGGSGGSSSTNEVGKPATFFQMEEYDLINHIPQSSDMFDLALFLAKNRGSNNGGF